MSRPFARGSVGLKLYAEPGFDAVGALDELCEQAALAHASGFDGIMISEHHGGLSGYFPSPQQIAGFVLGATKIGWAAACPLILPLRSTGQVAEEIAWLDARYPERVGVGVCMGAFEADFEMFGQSFPGRVERFRDGLPALVAMLEGSTDLRLAEDRALQRCAVHPIPVLSAAMSQGAARRAARAGAGLLTEGFADLPKLAALCSAFDDAGGTAAKVLSRRVWVGVPPASLLGGDSAEDQTVSSRNPTEIADRLAELLGSSGADSLCLRMQSKDVLSEQTREQIEKLGHLVLPALRERFDANWLSGPAA